MRTPATGNESSRLSRCRSGIAFTALDLVMNLYAQDRDLVTRARSGEAAAFEQLVRRYRQRILKLAFAYTQDLDDAEDAAQETFIKAYWGLLQYRGDAAFYSWLHRIAVNSATMLLAVRARDARTESLDQQDADAAGTTPPRLTDGDTPEELALTEEICRIVNGAIDGLPGEQRRALILHELEGHSYVDIATAMGTPIGTVRSRIFRAREAIDKSLRRVFVSGLGRRTGAERVPGRVAS